MNVHAPIASACRHGSAGMRRIPLAHAIDDECHGGGACTQCLAQGLLHRASTLESQIVVVAQASDVVGMAHDAHARNRLSGGLSVHDLSGDSIHLCWVIADGILAECRLVESELVQDGKWFAAAD